MSRKLMLSFSLILILTGCGVQDHADLSAQIDMTEEEALDTLKEVPMQEGGRNIFGRRSRTSAAQFLSVMQDLIESGQLTEDDLRGVTGSDGDSGSSLDNIAEIFNSLQNGGATGIWGIAKALLNLNSGSGGETTGILGTILNLLNAAAPIISTFFPALSPIISALTVIVPIVSNLIGGFFSRFRRSSSIKPLIPNFSPEFATLTKPVLFHRAHC